MQAETTLQDKNGVPVCVGDVFEFSTWDSDDNVSWTFRYYVKSPQEFVYLGGGIDFGTAVGKIDSLEEIQELVECQDPMDRGIVLLGLAAARAARQKV